MSPETRVPERMVPSKRTLSRLKAAVYLNSVRLFVDACALFRSGAYPSACALAILALEELGKLEMVDHICDDISMNPDWNPRVFLANLFSRDMFLSHRNKQMWALGPFNSSKSKRVRDIAERRLDGTKLDALYVGYAQRRIRQPSRISARRARLELSIALTKIKAVRDAGFNGFDCWSTVRSQARARRYVTKASRAYSALSKPRAGIRRARDVG